MRYMRGEACRRVRESGIGHRSTCWLQRARLSGPPIAARRLCVCAAERRCREACVLLV